MSKKVLRTLSALMLGTGQEFIFQFLTVLVWIRAWGAELYSEWLLIYLFPNLLLRGNVGIFHGATSDLIQFYSVQKFEEAGETYSSLKVGQIIFLVGVAIIYIVAAALLASFGKLNHFTSFDILVIGALFYIQFLLFQMQQSRLCLLKADNKAATAIMWQNTSRLATMTSLIALAPITSPKYCLLGAITAQLGIVLATIVYSRESRTQIQASLAAARKTVVLRLLRNGIGFSIFPFGQTISHSISVWTVGFFLGAPAGAAFHNMRTITRSLVLVARAGEQAVRFELSRLFATGETQDAQSMLGRAVLGGFLVSLIGLIFLMVFGREIFEILTNNELTFELDVFAVLCISSLFHAMALIYLSLAFSINEHSREAVSYFILTLIACAAYIPAARSGILAVAFVTLLSDAAIFFLARYRSSRLIDLSASGK